MKPKKNKSKMIYFDVDDTLVMFKQWKQPGENKIKIRDRMSTLYLTPHKKHIELLKSHSKNGDYIVVWSQAGHDWAKTVCKALNIKEFVDLYLTKPTVIYDDLQPMEWMPERIYFEDNT